jgi:predicted phosphodiesterase
MRCLVFSDIHGNLEALEAVLEHAEGVEQYWCLGDIVGYGPNPNECVDRVKTLPSLICLSGNHDRIAFEKLDMRAYGLAAHKNAVWTQEQLTPQNIEFLGKLPMQLSIGQFTLVHASTQDPLWEYVNTPVVAHACLENCSTSYCLVGHTHIPAIFMQERGKCYSEEILWEKHLLDIRPKRAILNPGSIGLSPHNDGYACYLILDTETLIVDFRQISYSIEITQRKMEQIDILKNHSALNNRLIKND